MAYQLGYPDGGVAEPETPGDARAKRRRRRFRDVAVVTIGLVLGFAGPTIVGEVRQRLQDKPDSISARSDERSLTAAAASGRPLPAVAIDTGDAANPTPAATSTEAVERFLKAESESDHTTSFALLSDADRTRYRSPAAWRAAHATIFPVVGFETHKASPGTPVVIADVRYRSTIDEVVGVVPARANVAWPTVTQHGGWLVEFSKAQVKPEFPPDPDALTAATKWATQRQRCRKPEEYSAGLVGRARLADELCGARGAPSAGSVARLDATGATPFISAFGASITTAVRTVDLAGPVPMVVVLAPLEDRWLVVGVLDPT